MITATIGFPLIFVAGWFGGWTFAAVAAAVLFLASTEFVRGWLIPSHPVIEGFQFWAVSGAVAATAGLVQADERAPLVAALLAVFCAGVGYGPTRRFGPRRPYRVFAWSLVYLGVLGSGLVLVRGLGNGREWFFLALLATFATDTSAYATGRLVGRRRLWPRVSPNKTWEGAVGGLAAGVIVVLALNVVFELDLSSVRLLALVFTIPVAAQLGDFFESWMKRRMGIKDASGLLPGHGGFLDRLDSVLFVMPCVFLIAEAGTS